MNLLIQLLKAMQQQYWPMVRLDREKLIQWWAKKHNSPETAGCLIKTTVCFYKQSATCGNRWLYVLNNFMSKQVSLKYTMNNLEICLIPSLAFFTQGGMRKTVSLWRIWWLLNAHQLKTWSLFCMKELKIDILAVMNWTKTHQDHTQYLLSTWSANHTTRKTTTFSKNTERCLSLTWQDPSDWKSHSQKE